MSVEALFPAGDSKRSDYIAGTVRAEAARAGFSQSSLARALGMTQATVNARWRGIYAWSVDELDAISLLLAIPFEDLTKDPRSVGLTGGDSARLEGLEPPTFWLVANQGPACEVVDFAARRATSGD